MSEWLEKGNTCMSVYRLCLLIPLIVAQLLMIGCALDIETKADELEKFSGANANLLKSLRCLHGKTYPNDVDNCGIASFGSEPQLNEVETCLRSQKTKKTVNVLVENPIRVGLTADCKSGRIFVLFRPAGDKYVVHDVGFLMD